MLEWFELNDNKIFFFSSIEVIGIWFNWYIFNVIYVFCSNICGFNMICISKCGIDIKCENFYLFCVFGVIDNVLLYYKISKII